MDAIGTPLFSVRSAADDCLHDGLQSLALPDYDPDHNHGPDYNHPKWCSPSFTSVAPGFSFDGYIISFTMTIHTDLLLKYGPISLTAEKGRVIFCEGGSSGW